MSFAKEMHSLAMSERSRRKAELKAEAETIFNSYKSTIKYYASRGQMSTAITIPLEYKGEERDALGPALREILIENGFKVATVARDKYHISWDKVNEAF